MSFNNKNNDKNNDKNNASTQACKITPPNLTMVEIPAEPENTNKNTNNSFFNALKNKLTEFRNSNKKNTQPYNNKPKSRL